LAVYAADTAVSAERSRAEIESTLRRYGATAFGYMSDQTRAVIGFEAFGRRIKFILPMPDPKDPRFLHPTFRGRIHTWKNNTPERAFALWEQAARQRWRALALCIKAKLETVNAGIRTFESEFLNDIVLPNGLTVGETMKGQIENAYKSGKMPPLLGYEEK
jgi:hypothetical protein